MIAQITPVALAQRLSLADAPLVLDVREDWEREVAQLPATLNIPMMEVPQRLQELPRDRDIVVLCRSGGRSLKVAEFLSANGFERVWNLTGGILAWGREVDPTLSSY